MHKELVKRLRAESALPYSAIKDMRATADAIEELTDRNVGTWINYLKDGFVECPFCHSATNYDGDMHYCFNCGAKLEGNDDV